MLAILLIYLINKRSLRTRIVIGKLRLRSLFIECFCLFLFLFAFVDAVVVVSFRTGRVGDFSQCLGGALCEIPRKTSAKN